MKKNGFFVTQKRNSCRRSFWLTKKIRFFSKGFSLPSGLKTHIQQNSISNKNTMYIKPKIGIDQIKFGMYPKDIEKLLGKPNKIFQDDDQNQIYIYNDQKLTLTFYDDEDLKLGYLTVSNPKANLLDLNPMGEIPNEFLKKITQIKTWEHEDFDTFEHHFNEEYWIILVSEFNQITKIELGVCINKDEFMWPK